MLRFHGNVTSYFLCLFSAIVLLRSGIVVLPQAKHCSTCCHGSFVSRIVSLSQNIPRNSRNYARWVQIWLNGVSEDLLQIPCCVYVCVWVFQSQSSIHARSAVKVHSVRDLL